jgi:AAA-like domain
MEKSFNITARCFPQEHYMADVSKKMEAVIKMVKKGDYFIINRPRQYGKTTTLYYIAHSLMKTEDYLVFHTSFEGIGDIVFQTEEMFCKLFIKILQELSQKSLPEAFDWLISVSKEIADLKSLSKIITELTYKTNKRIVLIIDEVDKSSNNQLFISFLAMLRDKYMSRDEAKTFHSVVLAGVHDVKTLKLKLRPDAEKKLNSPWNIAAEFKVDMNLQPSEIKPMLDEYVQDKGVKMSTQKIADRLFYHTSGYPFLVSKLCKMLDEEIIPEKGSKKWLNADVDTAARQLITESNTNFDSLIANLENNEDLYNAVYSITIDNESRAFNIHNPTTNLGVIYGVFVNQKGLAIHNRIYRELLVNYMTDKMHEKQLAQGASFSSGYKNDDNSINMELVLLKFQAFMREQYSKKDRDFLERQGRLLFLAFIKPIINGVGYDFKEPQISEENRLDVAITYNQFKYIAELKIWRGEKAHEKGLIQLAQYLDKQGLNEGYLLIFDHSSTKSWASKWEEVQNKKIFMIWV